MVGWELVKMLLALVALVAVGFTAVTGLLIGIFICGFAAVGALIIVLVQDPTKESIDGTRETTKAEP